MDRRMQLAVGRFNSLPECNLNHCPTPIRFIWYSRFICWDINKGVNVGPIKMYWWIIRLDNFLIKCLINFPWCWCGLLLPGFAGLHLSRSSTPAIFFRAFVLWGAGLQFNKIFIIKSPTPNFILFYLKPNAKFLNPRTNPSGRKVTWEKERLVEKRH